MHNIDQKTVADFGNEWTAFDQQKLTGEEFHRQFELYFKIFPWDKLPGQAKGFDMGCGSGRWARLVAPRIGELHCIDASEKALAVARKNLDSQPNCRFHQASFEAIPLADRSMDFGYSLGVLHHIPDTLSGLQSCVDKLKPGSPFLAYLYYAFDNKPAWFKMLWKISDLFRRGISGLPFKIKHFFSQGIAFFIYFPLARFAWLLEKLDINVEHFPLSQYRAMSLYTMRTDALDRFSTRLEKRFTRKQLIDLFEKAGLERVEISNDMPYWCVVGYKKST